jgi:TolB-like protein
MEGGFCMLRFFSAVLLLLAATPADAAAPADVQGRIAVAISYFDNNTGKAELAPLAKGLADMLITDLSQVSTLQIVERDKLNQALAELRLSRSKYIDPKTAQRLGHGLAARYILSGGYVVAKGNMRIDVRIFEVESGTVLASEEVEGKEDEFFSLEKDLVDILIRTLQVRLAAPERTKLRTNATQSLAAFKQYALGLDATDRGEPDEARTAFEQALANDPNYLAARTASERLAAFFAHRDQQTNASADDVFRSLNPKAPHFAQKVDALLMSLDNGKTEQFKRKVALLQWLAGRELLVCERVAGPATGNPTVLIGGVPTGGTISYCRQAHEVLGIAYRLYEDPSQWDVIPKVCEYFINRLPGDQAVASYCEHAIMGSLRSYQRSYQTSGREGAAKKWAEDRAWDRKFLQPGDWRLALLDNEDGMKNLIATYAPAQQ